MLPPSHQALPNKGSTRRPSWGFLGDMEQITCHTSLESKDGHFPVKQTLNEEAIGSKFNDKNCELPELTKPE